MLPILKKSIKNKKKPMDFLACIYLASRYKSLLDLLLCEGKYQMWMSFWHYKVKKLSRSSHCQLFVPIPFILKIAWAVQENWINNRINHCESKIESNFQKTGQSFSERIVSSCNVWQLILVHETLKNDTNSRDLLRKPYNAN